MVFTYRLKIIMEHNSFLCKQWNDLNPTTDQILYIQNYQNIPLTVSRNLFILQF